MSRDGNLMRALNKVTKWRGVFAGWQLGTRAKGDPESDALRDHREVTILLRIESSALANLLIKKGMISGDEWADQLLEEAVALDRLYEARFPGIKTTDDGVTITAEAAQTMRGWKL